MSEIAEHLTIRAFKAMDEPETCSEFIREHRRVLEDYGIASVITNNEDWVKDKNCFVIVIEHDELGMIGGARILVSRHASEVLPIQDALSKHDPAINKLIGRLNKYGVGEICGLWNANRFPGKGLPQLLGLSAISIANQIGLNSLVCVVAKYTLKYSLRLGFSLVEEVGVSGIFDPYPKPGFLGIVIGLEDLASLDFARRDLRQRILSLRMRPEQSALENTGRALLHVSYSLQLRESAIDSRIYREVDANRLRHTA